MMSSLTLPVVATISKQLDGSFAMTQADYSEVDLEIVTKLVLRAFGTFGNDVANGTQRDFGNAIS